MHNFVIIAVHLLWFPYGGQNLVQFAVTERASCAYAEYHLPAALNGMDFLSSQQRPLTIAIICQNTNMVDMTRAVKRQTDRLVDMAAAGHKRP